MSKKKINYDEIAKGIIENVGGKENVKSLRHCFTRLRFVLLDEEKANKEALKDLDGVVSIVQGSGEYMIVIGDKVALVYNAVCDRLGINSNADTVVEDEAQKPKGNIISRVLSIIMASMHPLIYPICA